MGGPRIPGGMGPATYKKQNCQKKATKNCTFHNTKEKVDIELKIHTTATLV
jgi:hypothetical protein